MSEPTDAEVAAFKDAWLVADDDYITGKVNNPQPGDRTRAGLRAAFAEHDRLLPPQEVALLALADTTVQTVDWWRAVVTLVQCGWRPPEIDGALRLGSPQTVLPPDLDQSELVTDPRIGTWRRHTYEANGALGCARCGMAPSHVVHLAPEPPHVWSNPTDPEGGR